MAAMFQDYNYDASGVSEEEMEKLILLFVRDHKVVMFSKQECVYCWKVKSILDLSAQPYREVDVSMYEDGPMIQRVLGKITGRSTVPRIFIRGKCVGGCEKLSKLYDAGKLAKILKKPAVPQRTFHGSWQKIWEKDVGEYVPPN